MGRMLAREHPVEADLVCGVPDSGLEAAWATPWKAASPIATGFVKNRYNRPQLYLPPPRPSGKHAVDLKLNPLRAAVEGKRVVLVDDSIVRGTTCDRIVAAMRRAGAKEVHLRISSPPFRHTCYFGTDIGSERTSSPTSCPFRRLRKRPARTPWGYISVEGLLEACRGSRLGLCTGALPGSTPPRWGRPPRMHWRGKGKGGSGWPSSFFSSPCTHPPSRRRGTSPPAGGWSAGWRSCRCHRRGTPSRSA